MYPRRVALRFWGWWFGRRAKKRPKAKSIYQCRPSEHETQTTLATMVLRKTTLVPIALLASFLSCTRQLIRSSTTTTRRMDGSSTSYADAPPLFLPVAPSSSSLPPPTDIYVLGERNSGTNYAAGVLRDAFDPTNSVDATRTHEYFSSDVPVLRHKHMFRHSLLYESELEEVRRRTDVLWILAVRRPCDWAEAMKRMPYHMCKPNDIPSTCPGDDFVGFEHYEELMNYSLAEFFRMEWGDWTESTNFRNVSFVSGEFTYRNVFHLRRHKLGLMRQIIDAVPRNVKVVRLHELELSPEVFVKASIDECFCVHYFCISGWMNDSCMRFPPTLSFDH